MTPAKITHLLQSPDTCATTLLIMAADRLSVDKEGRHTDFMAWDPQAIQLEMADEYGCQLAVGNFNKLMAAIELCTSNIFYKSCPDFVRLCVTLTHGLFDPETFEPADAGDVAWGITEAMLIWPEQDEEDPFMPDIIAYIGKAIQEEGIMVPPDILRLGLGKEIDRLGKVQAQFSDDPIMFNAIYKAERDKTEDINEFVKGRLRALLQQVESLDLQHGETKGAVKQMFSKLQRTSTESSKLKPPAL